MASNFGNRGIGQYLYSRIINIVSKELRRILLALLKKYPDRITSVIYNLLAQEPSIDMEAPTEIKRGLLILNKAKKFKRVASKRTIKLCAKSGDRFVEKDRVPHLLFYGPFGTGKTTTILAFARKLYGSTSFELKLNASDDQWSDMQARNALRRSIVLNALNCNISLDGISALQRIDNGDMRKALNGLQVCHVAYNYIDETVVYKCTGNPEPEDIKYIVLKMNLIQHILVIKARKSFALQDIVAEVHKYLNNFEMP
ncbi:10317_t:CDS:2, partial [Diversispora eburnea]